MNDDINIKSKAEKWIDQHSCGHYIGYRRSVITFIANIRFHSIGGDECESEDVIHLFRNGYCYYFAKMLQNAFGGDLYWHQNHGHIVWSDNGIRFYDIDGPFDLYEESWEMVPIGFLGNMVNDFKHVEEYNLVWSLYAPFIKWKRENYPYESDAGIVSTIFMGMPPYTEYHPGDTVESEVYNFWQKNPDKCKEIIDNAISNS